MSEPTKADLEARIEALEQQNADLRGRLWTLDAVIKAQLAAADAQSSAMVLMIDASRHNANVIGLLLDRSDAAPDA